MGRRLSTIITCEHAGNQVPKEFSQLFRGHTDILSTHRAYDPGALELARNLSEKLSAPLCFSLVTRLFVDLNRSLHNPRIFSEISSNLTADQKMQVLGKYYYPCRKLVDSFIAAHAVPGESVLHLSVHTFAPVLNGKRRNADIGLLYDPSRPSEKTFCRHLTSYLSASSSAMTVRSNYPYRGTADGFTSWLRRRYREEHYLGIELEVNQKYPLGNRKKWMSFREMISRSVVLAVSALQNGGCR